MLGSNNFASILGLHKQRVIAPHASMINDSNSKETNTTNASKCNDVESMGHCGSQC